MFESDQHEFDEEYTEAAHPAPPSAKTTASPTAVAEPIVEEPEEEPAHDQFEEQQEFVDPAERPPAAPPQKKPMNLILYGGFGVLALFGIFILFSSKSKTDGPPPGDLGPGIVAVSGLRGHLSTKWDGDAKTGRLAYQLRIEPMEDRWGPGFTYMITHAPMPISVNVRLLDASGFALCGKEIDFRFDPQNAVIPVSAAPATANGKKIPLAARIAAQQAARQSEIIQMQAAEAARERGKDLFQEQTGHDGQITAVNAQGALPCSPDQYKRADYWDFNSNFPTLEEQAALLDPKAAALAKKLEQEYGSSGKHTSSRYPQQGFIMQGDDRVTGYDAQRGILMAEDDKSFLVDKRLGRETATAWANNYALIHYKCDQHGFCALTEAGGSAGLRARLNE